MSSKHTAGPWFISPKGGRFCVDASSGEEGSDYRIAKTYASPFAPDQEQSAANARLISASPDLLEALIAASGVLWMAAKYAEGGGEHGPEMAEYRAAVAAIDAALEKVHGGAKP